MVIATNTQQPLRHVCACDRALPRDQQTVWILNVLDVPDAALIVDLVRQADSKAGSGELVSLRLGLAGVENFRDEAGVEIRWEAEEKIIFGRKRVVVSDAFLKRLPPDVREELAGAIYTQRVHEDDRKNS